MCRSMLRRLCVDNFNVTRHGIDSPQDKTSVIVKQIGNIKYQCFRLVQGGNVTCRSVYRVTDPVIGQNHRRIYNNPQSFLKDKLDGGQLYITFIAKCDELSMKGKG